jgi:hypothetical protein
MPSSAFVALPRCYRTATWVDRLRLLLELARASEGGRGKGGSHHTPLVRQILARRPSILVAIKIDLRLATCIFTPSWLDFAIYTKHTGGQDYIPTAFESHSHLHYSSPRRT